MTRDQLLLNLEESQLIMQDIVKMQNICVNIQKQYMEYIPKKKIWTEKLGFGKRQIIITFVSLCLTTSTLILYLYYLTRLLTFYLPVAISDTLTYVLAFAISIFMPKLVAKIHNIWPKKMNARIEEQNKHISLKNESLMEEERKTIEIINELSAKLRQIMSGWFPLDYATMHHVEAFLHYIRNYEADTMKEAITCYKADAYRTQMEQDQRALRDGQAEMIRQQKFGNMLAIGSLFMQAKIQDEIRQNTQAVNDAASRCAM